MPKIFSAEDREVIRKQLLAAGRDQFLRYGLRKTRVEELAGAVGIAKGTFYNFFSSKEELCFEIFEAEENGVAGRVREILEGPEDAAATLQAVLDFSMDYVQKDSLLRQLRESGEFSLLGRGINRERLAEHQNNDQALTGAVLEVLKNKGAGTDLDPAVLAGLFRALVMIPFHMREIGEDVYPRVIRVLTEAVTRRITGGPEGGRA